MLNSVLGTYTVTVDQTPSGRQLRNIVLLSGRTPRKSFLVCNAQLKVYFLECKFLQSPVSTGKLHHSSMWIMSMVVLKFNLGRAALHPRVTSLGSSCDEDRQQDRVLRAATSLVGVHCGGTAAHHQLVNDY